MPISSRPGRRFALLPAVALVVAALAGTGALAADARGAEPLVADERFPRPAVCIALGAGGASGLAHILMLEALDELHITPHLISGSSIGAIVGALYASGMSGKQIRELIEEFIISSEERLSEELLSRDALRWIDFIELEFGEGGLLSSEGFITFLYETLKKSTFEELEIPLRITAADLWEHSEVTLESGELLPAIKASMALPGVFRPVTLGGRVLIDGGTVNPVPFDLLTPGCDIVVAIDVIGRRTAPGSLSPGYFETIFGATKVMQHAITAAKLRNNRPDIYIAPPIVDVRALEFYRAHEVFAKAQPAKRELKHQLEALLRDR